MAGIFAALLAVIVGTWNGNWFPSGRAEHRAEPEVEEATVSAAARYIRAGIEELDPARTNQIVLVLNEIRNEKVAAELAAKIDTNLVVATISGYRRRDRFDMQQDVILTTLPVADKGWCLWKSKKGTWAPRGYAYADLLLTSSVTTRVYAVHLKSNYGATTDEIRADNTRKREMCAEQLVEQERPRRGRPKRPVIIAGDFNCDQWRKDFAGEETIGLLTAVGFTDVLSSLPPKRRWTHPSRRYGNYALDHILLLGLDPVGLPLVTTAGAVSDHYILLSLVAP